MTIPASGPTPTQPPTPPRTSPPSVSLVICTQNRPDELRQCLQALQRLTTRPSEILVVDNTAGDPATNQVARSAGARYIVEPVSGLSRARNTALAASTSEIVAFIDDDALPEPDWLERVLEPFSEPSVAVVTGETFTSRAHTEGARNTTPRRLTNHTPLWFEIATFGGLGFGTNMALRKPCCHRAQFFDERLGRGAPFWIAEESHAFASLVAQGYQAVHVPGAIVIHPSKPADIQREASTSFAYWLLLFFEFRGHRMDLIRFLFRRLRRKPLAWPRDPQEPGEVINSGWRIYLSALISGSRLYFRNRRSLRPPPR